MPPACRHAAGLLPVTAATPAKRRARPRPERRPRAGAAGTDICWKLLC